MKAATKPKLSTQLLSDTLREVVQDVDEARENLDKKLQTRNEIIRDFLQLVPMERICRITGLTREQLYRIKTSVPRDDR